MITKTLQQKYIGEKVPELWIKFETNIRDLREKKPLMSFKEVLEVAENSSILDESDFLQAIRFLGDLGTIQYFETSGLKDKIVIDPQWIGKF